MMKEEMKLNDNKNPPSPPTPAPPHFVLIHGISGGAWCWYKIRCLMENCGYKVTCLDLKGAGMDPTDPNTVLSFQDYNKPLIDFLSSLHDDHQVSQYLQIKSCFIFYSRYLHATCTVTMSSSILMVQVILVGHSAGGLSLSDGIQKFGKKKIKLAVFVAATMLKSGFLTHQDIQDVSFSHSISSSPISIILQSIFIHNSKYRLNVNSVLESLFNLIIIILI